MNCQDHLYRNADPQLVARRWFLQQCGVGLGAIALAQLLGEAGYGRAAADGDQSAGRRSRRTSPPRPSG